MNRKTTIATLGALVVGTGVLLSTSQAQAFFRGSDNHQNMAQDLAEKLGKSESDVQSALDEVMNDGRQQKEEAFSARLSKAVDNKIISEDQKALILAKREELRSQFESERQQREAHQAELKTWAESNGIDLSFLGEMGLGYGRGEGMGMHRGR